MQAGQNNFDLIRYDYYRDDTVAIEALKAGEYDFRVVGSATEWATAYDFPPVDAGMLVKETIPHQVIRGMHGFCFNTRRRKFADPKVRQAISYSFDFEWTNSRLLHNFFGRSKSYWNNSDLASSDFAEEMELAILEKYRSRIPDDIFTTAFEPPATDGSGDIRPNLRMAKGMLAAAGWRVVDNALTHTATGAVMTIEFLLCFAGVRAHHRPHSEKLETVGHRITHAYRGFVPIPEQIARIRLRRDHCPLAPDFESRQRATQFLEFGHGQLQWDPKLRRYRGRSCG